MDLHGFTNHILFTKDAIYSVSVELHFLFSRFYTVHSYVNILHTFSLHNARLRNFPSSFFLAHLFLDSFRFVQARFKCLKFMNIKIIRDFTHST